MSQSLQRQTQLQTSYADYMYIDIEHSKIIYFMCAELLGRQEVDVERAHRIENAMKFICWHDMFQVS